MWGSRFVVVAAHLLLLFGDIGGGADGRRLRGSLATRYSEDAHHVHVRTLSMQGKKQDKLNEKLLKATSSGKRSRAVEKLLSDGADPDATERFNRTSLHFSGFFNDHKTAKVLIKAGANVNVVDGDGITPLHNAVVFNAIKVAKVLIKAGADVDSTNADGNTPLHIAAQRGFVGMSKLLVKKGADRSIENNDGNTPGEEICIGVLGVRACAPDSTEDTELRELLL